MTVWFKGIFETDFTVEGWTLIDVPGIAGSPPNPPTRITAAAYPPSAYGCRCQTLGQGISPETRFDRVAVQKSMVAANSYYAQMLFRLNQNLTANGERITIMSMRSATGAIASCGVVNVGGVLRWTLMKATRAIHPSLGPTVGMWHLVEFHHSQVTGMELFIDGNATPVLTLNEISGEFIVAVQFGVAISNTAYPVSVDLDDCTIADAYIGGAPSAPVLNISSNPELNVPVYVDDGLGGPLVFIGNTPIVGYAVVARRTYRVQVEPEVTR